MSTTTLIEEKESTRNFQVGTAPARTQSWRERPRWDKVFWIGLIHAGCLLIPWVFSWTALLSCLIVSALMGSLGVCLGYHRLITHRSFSVPKPLEYFFVLLGTLAFQGGPIWWVAGHRYHHLYSDEPDKDPHSPRRGFWWAHMLWLFYQRQELSDPRYYYRIAPDLAKDRFYRFLDNYHWALQLSLAVALFCIGGFPALIWGGFVRITYTYHTTWLVNSATHLWGYRSFKTSDNSRNLWWVSLLASGEGWHNNHHAFPYSARHGLRWWEFDATFLAIRLLKWVGLAKGIRIPSKAVLQSTSA